MAIKEKRQSNILHYIVISYMLLALVWWSYLLYNKNNENFVLQSQLYPQEQEAIKEKYQRQKTMIIGESIFFGIALITGIWLINRSYRKEVLANEKQSNFLLSITHELKSPLASIKLILQTFLRRELDQDKRNELSKNALIETNRLESMVSNILLATKLDHAYQYNFESHNISQLINERLELFGKKFPERKMVFNGNQSFFAHVDKEAFISIITNLVENAHKYSPDETAISITLTEGDNHYEIQVADNGIGIGDADKNKIYEKFFRVGNEDTRQTKGSGLGLYIVKELVEAHKGKISLKNNQPKGSIFVIKLASKPN